MKISAVINTYNEESNLGYCLQSLIWCDEIVVVDMESTDKTTEIAEKYGARVILIPKLREFDKARKVAIESAKFKWVLLVDADEIIPKTLAAKIKSVIQTEESDVYKIPRVNYFYGRKLNYCGVSPDYQIRLFKKDAIFVTGIVHDFLKIKDGMSVTNLERNESISIIHFAYNDLESIIDRINLYTTLEAERMNKYSKHIIWVGIKEFLFRYIRCRGFLDGYDGYIHSLVLSIYKMQTNMKKYHIDNFIDIKKLKDHTIVDKVR